VGAPESNAGDDFHFWWAASRALGLIQPGAELRKLTLEGLGTVDDPDDSYETVDVGEFFGGADMATATATVLSQLKYSTRHPDQAWTSARLTARRRRRNSDGSSGPDRSVVADLAAAYQQVLDDHGPEAAAKTTIALVSNQPGDALLLQAVAAAARWASPLGARARRAAMLSALNPEHAVVIREISEAVGAKLTSERFCGFIASLDLAKTGSLERSVLARAVRAGCQELTPGKGPDSANRLFQLVREQAMPGRHEGLTKDDVLAALAAPELVDLYPAPPRFLEITDPLKAPGASRVADAVLANPGRLLVAHGPAGAGKTTALQQVADLLPDGSVVVLFDCYGGGDFLSSGEERHTPQRFVTQVINELAQQCGTPLMIQPPQSPQDLWRRFSRTLERAAGTLAPGAVLVVAADAADNSAVAAETQGDRSFLPGLVGLRLPAQVSVLLTARSHRVPSLGAGNAVTMELAPFDLATSATHLRRYRPEATDEEASEFHSRTDGNPRAQYYALTQAAAKGSDMPGLLSDCANTPEPVFAELLRSALEVTGSDAGGQRWLAMMLALSRPVDTMTLASALDVDTAAVTAFARGLAPGVQLSAEGIQFRDEDFETYIRDSVDKAAVTTAHSRLADMFLVQRTENPDAAAHVADHLAAAGRPVELIELVLLEDYPAGIADGLRREQVQARRLDLAARAAAHTSDAASAVRLAARSCDTASRTDTLSKLVESRLDLVARYTDIDLLRTHALREGPRDWLAPTLMRLAAALSRDPERHEAARAELDRANAWLRRWMAGRDTTTGHWNIEADDIAAAAEARYRLGGPGSAAAELRRWRPVRLVHEATAAFAARLGGEYTPGRAQAELTGHRIPLAQQGPFLAHADCRGEQPDRAWVNEVARALTAVSPGQPARWQPLLLDVVTRYGDRQVAVALARHWAAELPPGPWGFGSPGTEGITLLRFHATAAALTEADLPADALVPPSLRAPDQADEDHGRGDQLEEERRARDRQEWMRTAAPLAGAAVLAVRSVAGEAGASDVADWIACGLANRTKRAGYRWFTYDRSYRAWAVLSAEAAVDAGAPADLLERLADAAPELIRDGAAEMWLDLAELLASRGVHSGRAADLCTRAAKAARADAYSASDRLDIIARAADIASDVFPELGKQLFDQAVDVATGINDDAAQLLAVHADLALRAEVPSGDRLSTATRLIAAAEAVAPHVSENGTVPYAEIARGAAYLHAATGLAAASRWDDEARQPLAATLPSALLGAVDGGGIPVQQALVLDHLIDQDAWRLHFQLDVIDRLRVGGAGGTSSARVALDRAADMLRLYVPTNQQPELARQFLDKAEVWGLAARIRPTLEPVAALSQDPDQLSTVDTDRWTPSEPRPAAQELLDNPASRSYTTLTADVAVLHEANVYGDPLRDFVASVATATPPAHRLDMLNAIASLPGPAEGIVLEVLADRVETWRDWPGVVTWAHEALGDLLAKYLTNLAWSQPTDKLLGQLRALADDDSLRAAILRALPAARPALTAYGWQNIAALLALLCDPDSAAAALAGLLADRAYTEGGSTAALPVQDSPIPALLWSTFGHSRRAMRWRAAHATRELLKLPGQAAAAVASALVRYLDQPDPGAFRDPKLHFYSMSATVGLLVALQRVAHEKPEILTPHLDDLARHATSTNLPHAQIRELARGAALALASPADPRTDTIRYANRPASCLADRDHRERTDRRLSQEHRYRFDEMDTIPYWYTPLARVFGVPVDTVAESAERWILDTWGLDENDWWTDARKLRDERTAERMSGGHGSIPPEESLRLYLEYHAMMTAAGELIDDGRSVLVPDWDEDAFDPWKDWLSQHLPTTPWQSELRTPVPADPAHFGLLPADGPWAPPDAADLDRIFGLQGAELADPVPVVGRAFVSRRGGYETSHIDSALVRPDHAADLQRALASSSEPTDWKLPDEDEQDFEVRHGHFELYGWLTQPPSPRESLDDSDPYSQGLAGALPMPGRLFRASAGAVPGPFPLVDGTGNVLARAEQWADPERDRYRPSQDVNCSGNRICVKRPALLRFLSDTGYSLIVEVQLGRHRSSTRTDESRAFRRSRIYLVHADGRVIGR
jgi:NACHT domain